jgi:hypothetical protein
MVAAVLLIAGHVRAANDRFFIISVVDEGTGRGVPLAELQTVNSASWWTDSAGIVAFDEPGLMGRDVFFHVSSPGYEYPKDFFGNRGLKVRTVPGGRVEVKLKRLNIAERLYRITGQGIYRDSLLAGLPVPLRQPVLNGEVTGQDTVIVTPYRGKLYWFWGDTDRASYPLGNFGASGATSELPGRGGLDPGVGVDLTYFTNTNGFSKAMCPVPGEGLRWIESVFTLRDESGAEQLLARMANHRDLGHVLGWHLLKFNDEREEFEPVKSWAILESHDSAHPFRARSGGVDYLHIYPDLRVRAELAVITEWTNYEAFTCIADSGKRSGAETTIERDAAGRAKYSWKPGADRLYSGRLRELTGAGKFRVSDGWREPRDVETGAPVEHGRGSVFWNEFRRRWISIASGKAGDVWFSEADTPTGPWVFARLIAVHGRYNFYNPTQHPFFDQEGGRVIYFEGTYTASFSKAPAKTPRYDYNQLMYRLSLDDPRLTLPAPVYRVKQEDGSVRHWMREEIETTHAWQRIEDIAFFAIPAQRPPKGLVPIYASANGNGFETNGSPQTGRPLFFALPDSETADAGVTSSLAALVPGQNAIPRCRVWKNPMTTLPLSFDTIPVSSKP